MTAYAYLEKLIADPSGFLTGSITPDAFNLDFKFARLLKFALLLHDIGKPGCQSRDEKGGFTFTGMRRPEPKQPRPYAKNSAVPLKSACSSAP